MVIVALLLVVYLVSTMATTRPAYITITSPDNGTYPWPTSR
jgi:hypothetical protein